MPEISQILHQLEQWKSIFIAKNELRESTIHQAEVENRWFTPLEINRMLGAIELEYLNRDKLEFWLQSYDLRNKPARQLSVGIIAAGNIPLVSFHDILCLLVSGHNLQLKLSDKDKKLPAWALNLLSSTIPEFKSNIQFVDQLKNYNAIIATGGELASNQFKYYFKDVPKIIRSHRNSVAVLTGKETTQDIIQLGMDIFSYYGLGCRNISKLYVPENFDFANFINILDANYSYVRLNNKYHNNYDYNLAIHTLNKTKFYQGESSLFIEATSIASRIACVHYEYFKDIHEVVSKILNSSTKIQSIHTNLNIEGIKTHSLGLSQYPGLTDYADGIDTLKFLLDIS